jgi:hypothetical protein
LLASTTFVSSMLLGCLRNAKVSDIQYIIGTVM